MLQWKVNGVGSYEEDVIKKIKTLYKTGPTGILLIGPDNYVKTQVIGVLWTRLPYPAMPYFYGGPKQGFMDGRIVFERPFWGPAQDGVIRQQLVRRFREAGAKCVVGVMVDCDFETDDLDLTISVREATSRLEPA